MQKKVLYGLIASLLSGSVFAGGPDLPPPPTPTIREPYLPVGLGLPPDCIDCFRPYIGIHYTYLNPHRLGYPYFFGYQPTLEGSEPIYLVGSTFGVANDYNGLGVSGGFKYGTFFGMEWGVTHFFNKDIDSNAGSLPDGGVIVESSYRTRTDMYYWDLRGYYVYSDTVDIIGSIGAGILSFNNRLFNSAPNLRLGFGGDYFFLPNWGIEGMFHWIENSSPICDHPDAGQFVTTGFNVDKETLFGCSYSSYFTVTVTLNYMFS